MIELQKIESADNSRPGTSEPLYVNFGLDTVAAGQQRIQVTTTPMAATLVEEMSELSIKEPQVPFPLRCLVFFVFSFETLHVFGWFCFQHLMASQFF